MSKFSISITMRRLPNDSNTFEFIISTPVLKTQLILPREMANKLRILIEKALIAK